MAAVGIDRTDLPNVIGNRVYRSWQVDIAADGDTLATGLSKIDALSIIPSQSSATQVGATISGGTITFKVGGAENNAQVSAIGTW